MRILKLSLTLFLALTAAALAAPSPYTQEHKYARVTVQQHKITSETQILVKDSSTGDIIGSACSNALTTGAFSDFGIVAMLDSTATAILLPGLPHSLFTRIPSTPAVSLVTECTMIMSRLWYATEFLCPPLFHWTL